MLDLSAYISARNCYILVANCGSNLRKKEEVFATQKNGHGFSAVSVIIHVIGVMSQWRSNDKRMKLTTFLEFGKYNWKVT
jgi:hypothetical protein